MKPAMFLKILGTALLTASLLSCGGGGGGGGGDGSAENASPPQQGQFIDAPVQGVKYVSGNQSGITDIVSLIMIRTLYN